VEKKRAILFPPAPMRGKSNVRSLFSYQTEIHFEEKKFSTHFQGSGGKGKKEEKRDIFSTSSLT